MSPCHAPSTCLSLPLWQAGVRAPGLPLMLVLALGFLSIREARADTVTYNSSGSFLVPTGVESITVQAWGAGGGGGGSGSGSFGGGGGGAYVSKNLVVSAGQTYTITVGGGGLGGDGTSAVPSAGGDSSVNLVGDGTLLVKAAGGAAGAGSSGGSGGAVANSTGTDKYAGGNGANASGNTGGGGGGSATTTAAGGNASGATGGTGTGAGGAGGAAAAGTNGSAPGGGGGGKGNGSFSSGAGAAGRIVITYTAATPASFSGIPASQNYIERTSGKLLLAPAGDLSDADSTDFDGGYLRVSFIANGEATEDRLFVREINNITLVSNLSITNGTYSGSIEVRHSGILIGTIAAANRGSDGTPLQIDLNANATVARTQDLLRSLYYENTDKENAVASTRTVRITVNDGDGGTATADSNLVVSAEVFSITSPSSGWTRLLNSTAFDPSEDQQAMSGPDLVGTLGTPLLYAKYDDKGTSSTADDTVTFRLRVDDSTNSAGLYNGYIFVGYDFEMDGDIDAFISMEGTTKGTKTYVYPATGANTSPSTTGLGTRQIIPNYNTATMSNYSTVQAIEGNTQTEANTYSGSDADLDYFQTFQMNYADLASVLNGIALNNHINAGNGYTTIGDLLVSGDFRTGFTEKTPFRFIIATSTQPNAINSDFGGVPRLDRSSSSLSWEALGAFSPQVTFGNLSPSFTSGSGTIASYTVPEGNTAVATLTANDPNDDALTFSIRTGEGYGVDGARFQIDPVNGALRFVTAPDYEAPLDAGSDNAYEVTVEISDGKGGTALQLVTVYVTDLNEGVNSRPVITSNGAGAAASVSISENTTTVTTVTSSDDGDFSGIVITASASYSISGGADAAKFQIDPATGLLTFVSAPDYENALDADQENTYVVIVRVTDGGSPVYFDDQTLTVTILDVPEPLAPVLTPADPAPTLPSLTEDETGNGGRTVAQILGTSATDTSGTVIGLAMTGTSATNGTWEYSLDGGANWIPAGSTVEYQLIEDDFGNLTTTAVFTNTGALSDANALLLRAEDLVRFKPNAENAGGGTLTYRAWDESNGFAGQYVDASTNGGTTAFSSSSDTATITTTDVNDAPTVSGGPVALTAIRDYQTSAAATVTNVLGAITYADVDTGHLIGMAVTGSSGAGTWQYSDDGVSWTPLGSVSGSSALLLSTAYRIRYVPAYAGPVGGEKATLTLLGWDQTGSTSGGAGTKVSAATTGGTSPFSSSSFIVEITVQEDDRAVTVTSPTVNEASPYAVFTVDGEPGQLVSLALSAGTATAGTGNDFTASMEVSTDGGATWTAYTSGTVALNGSGGTVLVRVPVLNDSTDEPDETFTLAATNLGGTAFNGTATIVDDGNGTIFNDDGSTNGSATKDDDGVLAASCPTVLENAGFIVFTITGKSNQYVSLNLLDGTAAGSGVDYGASGSGSVQLQTSDDDGATWTDYSSTARLNSSGSLLVRTAIIDDLFAEADETFNLVVTPISDVVATLPVYDVNYQTINLSGFTLVSGTAGATGAVYRKTNAATIGGQAIDVVVTIDAKSNVSSFTFDNDDSNASRFQPQINSSDISGSYVDFTFSFYKSGTSDPVALENFVVNPVDIDGNDGSSTREFVELSNFTNYQLGTGSLLTVAPGQRGPGYTRFNGREGALPGIPFENTASLIATYADPIAGFGLRAGVTSTNVDARLFSIAIGQALGPFTAPSNNTSGDAVVGCATILNDDTSYTINDITVNEAASTMTFTVTRAGLLGSATSVQAATSDGTATAGSDYTSVALTTLTFGIGETTKTFTVPILNDAVYEGPETVVVTLSNPSSGTAIEDPTGIGTIKDDGTGGDDDGDNTDDAGDTAKDDDRTVTVTSPTVNEASPYAVFTVDGEPGQLVSLALSAGTATAGTGNDFTASMEVSTDGGATWTAYTSGTVALNGSGGTVLVRVPVLNDSTDEPDETFTLAVTNLGGTAFNGTATIVDDGNGTIFNANGTTNSSATKDDDRPVSVTGGTVNEGSTWAVFSVTGAAGQLVSLSLVEGSGAGYADLDETQTLEWWNPSANAGAGGWVAYSSYATIPAGGTLLVRVNITQEQDSDPEGAETFQLSAANLSGASSSATMTIKDDGTGLIYPDAPPANASTPATSSSGLDDDRAMSLTNVTVNEASPWAVFTLTGIEGQTAILSLVNNGDGSDLVTIEYFDGEAWQPYSSSVTLPLNGPANGETATMLLRVALGPEQEAAVDGPETFTLVAATTGNTPSTGGVGTINDDGSGSIFLDSNTTATPDNPSDPGYSGPGLDDDRPSGTSPEINLRGGQISIRSGKTTLDTFDATDFGIAKAGAGGTSVVRTFTIENVGTGDLTLGGTPVVSVSGANASEFSVSQPSSANLAAAGSRTFTITFTPSTTGSRTASVSILNNDSNESPYTFSIGGEGRLNLAPIDLSLTGGRLEDGLDATDASPAYTGYFTASPDLGVDTGAAAYNTFTLVPGVGGSDNAKFQIYDGNKLRLRLGEPSADGLTDYRTRNSRRSTYNIRARVSDHEGNTYEKAFVVYVMMILSDEGDFFISDRGPYVSTGTVLLVSKAGMIQRIFSTTIADPYEITVDGNGDMIISNHEHDLSNVTALDDSGIYKIDRLSGVQTKIVGGATNGSVMPFVTPLGVKVETAGTYIVGDPDAYNLTGAIFRVDPAASPVTITELTRGGNLDYLQGVALAPNGDIYVSNVNRPVGSPSEVLKVDPVSGAQTVFASAGNLIYPTGLAVEEDGSAVVVVDALAKKVISIAIPGGSQTVISSDAQFIQPTHIAIEHTGDYLVTDGKSSSSDRRLFRVDKGTGIATQLSLNGSFEQPRGVTLAD